MKLLFFILSLVSLNGHAAPSPATTTSSFLKTGIGMFRSPIGFEISADKTQWQHVAPPSQQKHIATMYKAPDTHKGVQPLISVRVDDLRKKKSLNQYMRDWVKIYPRLGFRVLGTKKVKVSENRGFLLDLIHSKSQRQMRQVIFMRDKKAVVLSCRGHQDRFSVTVKSCNQIIRNFKWL